MATIIELDCMATVKHVAPLWNSPKNQIRRKLGPVETVYCGGVDGGTVRDQQGKCWDWWPTETVLSGNFREIRVVEAR